MKRGYIYAMTWLLGSWGIGAGLQAQHEYGEEQVKSVWTGELIYQFPDDSTLSFTLTFPEKITDEYLDLGTFNPISYMRSHSISYLNAQAPSYWCREGLFIQKGDSLHSGFNLVRLDDYTGISCCWKECDETECFTPYRTYDKGKAFTFTTYCNMRLWKAFEGLKFVYVYNAQSTHKRYVFVSAPIHNAR